MVLQDDVQALFSDPAGKGWEGGAFSSPFMSRAPAFTLRAAAMFPAVTHYDGTARVQTVSDREPWTFALLTRVKARIGFGILGNTSFNAKGAAQHCAWRNGAVQ